MAARIGGARELVAGRVWLGHSWHPEAGWAAAPELAGGGELELRPPRPGGLPGPATIVVGGSLRGAGAAPEVRAWARAGGAGAQGQRWSAGVEGAPGPVAAEGAPVRASIALAGPLGRVVDVGLDVRWEGLPRLGVPLGVPTPLEVLAPGGYGLARARIGLRLARLDLRLEGGPTVRPSRGVAVVGGTAKVSASVPIGRRAGISVVGLGAGFGSALAGGGGGGLWLSRGPVDVSVDLAVLRLRGLDHGSGWIADGRVRAGVSLLERRGPGLRVYGEVAAGADRLLAPYVRGGVGVEVRPPVPGRPS